MMKWNSSFYLLGFNNKSFVLYDGHTQKTYSNSVQYRILCDFFGSEEVTLDGLRKAYQNTYSLPEILGAFYGFVQDKIIIDNAFLTIAIEFPEDTSLREKRAKLELTRVQMTADQPALTVFVVSDVHHLQSVEFAKIKSKQFTVVWAFANELKLFPVFDTSETGAFFCFLHRIKRVFFSQLLTLRNHPLSLNDCLSTASLLMVLDYLPTFIDSNESQNTLLIFDHERLTIERAYLSPPLFRSFAKGTYEILDAHQKPANIQAVFEQLSFHLEAPLGLVDKLTSQQTPLGGWVSTGGVIFRSNQINAEIFFSRTRASGNGLTKDEAEAKAFCETLERYAQVFREHEDEYIIAAYNDLKHRAIHPNEILLYSPTQYRQENARSHSDELLVEFDENTPIAWSNVTDSVDDTPRCIPTFLLYQGRPTEDAASETFFKWITNGTAAGSTLDMAKLYALYEVIERDAYAIWWYNRLPSQGIDLAYIDHLEIVSLALAEHRRLGKKIYVFDITQDISIPTVAVVSAYLDGTYVLACASNISFEKACEKAFGELNQLYVRHLSKKTRLDDGQMQDIATALNHHTPQKPVWSFEKNDLALTEDLKIVETEIRKRGLNIYYKDLSRSDVLLPVVKAIVPGMRDLDTRFAPGRLYDVVSDLYGYVPAEESLRTFNLF